jgi:hypothetical protein
LKINKAHDGRVPKSYDVETGRVVAGRVAAKDLEALEQEDRHQM